MANRDTRLPRAGESATRGRYGGRELERDGRADDVRGRIQLAGDRQEQEYRVDRSGQRHPDGLGEPPTKTAGLTTSSNVALPSLIACSAS